MMMMLMSALLMLTLTTMLMILASIIAKKSSLDREKLSPFECGFDPKSSARLPFSLQFFMIALMFIIFDVEISILMPMITLIKNMDPMNLTFTMMTFILILIGGLYHEWNQKTLNWTI